MRTEAAMVFHAEENVGPTRLRIQTASSAKLPVVVVENHESGPRYHVFTVTALQAGLSNQPASHSLSVALHLVHRVPGVPMRMSEAIDAPIGTPIVENGRVFGVRAPDAAELGELTEADLADTGRRTPRRAPAPPDGDVKRGLLDRIKRPRGNSDPSAGE